MASTYPVTISANAEAAQTGARAARAAASRSGASRYTKWAIALFFVVLFVPGSFYVGVRMTPFRLYLILMALPMVLRFRADPTVRITLVDVLVFLAIAWRSLALLVNHQASEILNAGASFIELFFAYLLGRVFVRSAEDYRFFFRCFLVLLVALLPFALLELVTYTRVLRRVFGIFLAQPVEVISGPAIRFGLMRVQASFDHAVLFGLICSIGFANLFYIYHGKFFRRMSYTGFAGFMTLLAISSSSMLALVIQVGLIGYEIVLRRLWAKWFLLGSAVIFFLLSFEIIFSMSIGDYIATELALNQAGAETRLDQIYYGLKEVYRYPVFGIGLNTPALPFWRSDIFDNFWLYTAVRFGLPSLGFIAGAFGLHFLYIVFQRSDDVDYAMLRRGYAIALAATIVLIGSIPLWGSALVFVMAYFGAGAWFYDRPRSALDGRLAAPPRERGRPASAAPARPARAARPSR